MAELGLRGITDHHFKYLFESNITSQPLQARHLRRASMPGPVSSHSGLVPCLMAGQTLSILARRHRYPYFATPRDPLLRLRAISLRFQRTPPRRDVYSLEDELLESTMGSVEPNLLCDSLLGFKYCVPAFASRIHHQFGERQCPQRFSKEGSVLLYNDKVRCAS